MSTSPLHLERFNVLCSILLFAFLVIASKFVDGQHINQLTFVLKEADTEKNITNVTLQVKEKNLLTGKELAITEYMNSNAVDIFIADGEYELTFIADDVQT